MESIIYILVRMALRFHRHEWSVKYPSGCQSPDVIQKINAANGQLCLHVSSFFDVEVECEGGYWAGGGAKMEYLQSAGLPVKLLPGPNGKATPLSALLKALYALLRQHYGAINYPDLERFEVDKKAPGTTTVLPVVENEGHGAKAQVNEPGPSTTQKTAKASKVPDRLSTLRNKWATQSRLKAGPSGKGSVPSTLSNPIPVVTVENPKRVLDNHAEFFEAFEDAFYLDDSRTQSIDLSIYEHDKWYDQFDGLKAAVASSDKKPSGRSSKRKGDSEDEQFESYSGVKKRVRGSTFRMDVPHTVIEQPEPEASSSGAAEEKET